MKKRMPCGCGFKILLLLAGFLLALQLGACSLYAPAFGGNTPASLGPISYTYNGQGQLARLDIPDLCDRIQFDEENPSLFVAVLNLNDSSSSDLSSDDQQPEPGNTERLEAAIQAFYDQNGYGVPQDVAVFYEPCANGTWTHTTFYMKDRDQKLRRCEQYVLVHGDIAVLILQTASDEDAIDYRGGEVAESVVFADAAA